MILVNCLNTSRLILYSLSSPNQRKERHSSDERRCSGSRVEEDSRRLEQTLRKSAGGSKRLDKASVAMNTAT